jgi:uncharacterized protein YjbI with pentapeptide repeats
LSTEMTMLRERKKAIGASKASASSDIQQIIQNVQQLKQTNQTRWIEESLLQLSKKLDIVAKSDTEQRDALALIAAEREHIRLTTGISSGFLQAVGSTFILVTAFVALRNLRLSQKNLEVSENKLTSEIIAKATDHLGSETPIVRLGGINTLIWIAKSFLTQHENASVAAIAHTMAGFIVSRSQSDTTDLPSNFPIDIETALLFLLYRQSNSAHQSLEKINLASSQFSLRRFNGASLINVNLQNSCLKRSDLKKSSITECNFSQADLHSADLSGCEIKDSQFSLCILENAIVSEAKLVNCTFTRTKFGSSFEFSQVQAISDTDFSLAELQNAIFDGLDLSGIKFNGADLTGASFRNCKLDNVMFDNAILRESIFDHTKVNTCTFSAADLAMASLKDVELKKVNMQGSKNLTTKQLSEAVMKDVRIDDWLEDELECDS